MTLKLPLLAMTAIALTASAISIPAIAGPSASENAFGTDIAYVAITPARVLDTRDSKPKMGINTTGPMTAGETISVKLGPGGVDELPAEQNGQIASRGVTGIVANVTVTEAKAPGFLTVWAERPGQKDGRPLASNLNYAPGQTVANQVVIPTAHADSWDDASAAYAKVYAHEQAHVVIDVIGYMTRGKNYSSVTPSRLVDTRDGTGAAKEPIAAGQKLDIGVLGAAGVPAENVSAVVLNVTAVNPRESGFMTVYPAGKNRPEASNLNYQPDQIMPNLVTATVGAGGKVSIYSHATSDVVVDVMGYYTKSNEYTALTPKRYIDTRSGLGVTKAKLKANGEVQLKLSALNISNPETVTSVSLSVTSDAAEKPGFVTVYPGGEQRPLASTLNYTTGQPIANSTMAKVGADGTIRFFANESTHLIVDVLGYNRRPAPQKAQQIHMSSATRCVELTNGTTKCWGYLHSSGGPRVLPVAVSGLGSIKELGEWTSNCLLSTTNEILCLEENTRSTPPSGAVNAVKLPGISDAASVKFGKYYLSTDGKVKSIAAGTGDPNPLLTGVQQLSGQYGGGCAVMADTTVKCYGANQYGQLGTGNTTDSAQPVTVPGLTGVTSIATRDSSYCVATNAGNVWCWGNNAGGYLPKGDPVKAAAPQLTPKKIPNLTGVTQVERAGNGMCATLTDNTQKCWRVNHVYKNEGATNHYVGEWVDQVKPIAGAQQVAGWPGEQCVLMNNGDVLCNTDYPGDGTTGRRTRSKALL